MLVVLALAGMLAESADAYTVAGVGKRGFADFSKAIVFTGVSCPSNAETIQTNGGAKTCAIPMKAVGDGSWVCTAVVFPATSYSYYFEYRIPAYEDTNGWKSTQPGGSRNQDPTKDVTLPTYAKDGFVVYHIFGDKTVRGDTAIGKAGTLDTEITTANPYVANYRGSIQVNTTGDADTANLDNNNNASVTVTQTSDTTVRISWTFGHGGDGFGPTLEGAREFDTTSAATPYGFKILRAKLPAGWNADTTTPTHLVFEDTVVNAVTGDTLYSPNKSSYGAGWYSDAIVFTDTSLPTNTSVGDTFIYTVLWVDAYGNRNDTSDQNFGGATPGAAKFVRQAGIEAIFMVERFDPTVVFPNGTTEGTVYLTPWVNGVPQPFNRIKARAYIARRS